MSFENNFEYLGSVGNEPGLEDYPVMSRTLISLPQQHSFTPTPVQRTEAGFLIALPVVSVVILALYILSNRIQSAFPVWLHPFAQYDGLSDENEGSPPRKTRIWTGWTVLLGVVCFLGMAVSIVPVFLPYTRQPAVLFEVAPWLGAVILCCWDQPIQTPRMLLLQFVLILASFLARYSLHFLDHTLHSIDPFRLSQVILSAAGIIFILNMPLRSPRFSSRKIGSSSSPPTSALRSPEDNLTLFKFWTMSWVYPLLKVRWTRELVVRDIWQLPFEFQHRRLYHAFRDLDGNLLQRLGKANGLDLAIATSCSIIERVAEVSNIRLTSKMYQALGQVDTQEAAYWVLVMLFIDVGRQLAKTTAWWYSRKAYERSRGETFIALFGKLLTRVVPGSDKTEQGLPEGYEETPYFASRVTRMFSRWCGWRGKYIKVHEQQQQNSQPASNAKVVMLVRQDTYEISQRFWELCKLVSAPIKVALTLYYLYSSMGWSAMVGCAAMVFFMGLNWSLVEKLTKMEKERSDLSDKRAQGVAHFVEASRALKLNGWTESWKQRILGFRGPEMLKRLHQSYFQAAIGAVNLTGGMLYPLASIGLYTLVMGHRLPNEVIWPSLSLFAHLEVTVTELFQLASNFKKTTVPVDRVHKFMDEPDRDEQPGDPNARDIVFKNATFAWPATDNQVLHGLNLSFPSGLTIIKGKVGSGKTSLLLAALNEMDLRGGDLTRPNEPIAYGQQLPWLQNKTIKDNIVFHERWDAQRYKETLDACALNPDLELMPDNDKTQLGEGGIGLSGGQKARVALARIVYSSCRVLLLDDPLAALDHDTASKIVARLLKGPLGKGRTIVMVTHREDLVLPYADQVVEVDDGTARVLTREEIQKELDHPHNKPSHMTVVDEEPVHVGSIVEEAASTEEEPEEAGQTGSVKWSVYVKYMKAGGYHLWIALAFFYAVTRACDVSRAKLLEAWANDAASDASSTGFATGWLGLGDPDENPGKWIMVFGVFSTGQMASFSIAQLILARICFHAACGLFGTAIGKVGNATFRYLDTTSTGQLKNRLIADMGMVDGGILTPMQEFMYSAIQLAMSVVAIAVQQPWLLLFLAIMFSTYSVLFWAYTRISRDLRRMEMRYLTPIIENIGAMQDGLVTIRALRVENFFQDRHLKAVDDFQKHDHFYWSMQFWMDFRVSMSSATSRAALVLFMIWVGTPASAIGFVLLQTLVAMASVERLCQTIAQLQLDAVSLERVDTLNQIPEEPSGEDKPPEGWPLSNDSIKFEEVTFQYDSDLPKVLKDVSFEIPGGSTCAVLGRTGSGKSTIANALLATQLPSSGTVKIGGYDLSLIDRTTLRDRVTFIQQDPTLFPGTLRDNIDPQGRFSDHECKSAIQRVLGPSWLLDTQIDAAGKNLSQGQRQLVSIGRAIVRRSGVVILDEATASIDRNTAAKMQKLLREELAHSTVITIAHRLEAVEDASWCLRLDGGKVIECGPAKGLEGKGKETNENTE